MATPLAAAAAVVVAVTIVLRSPAQVDPVFRGEQVTTTFAALSPVGAAVVATDSLVFTWRATESDAHYAFTLTDADGDVVWSTQPTDTTAMLPNDVILEAGEYYYWFVDAFLDGANSATTGVQEFVAR